MSLTRYATVHYRKLVRDDGVLSDGKTLSQSVSEALERTHSSGVAYMDDWTLRLTPSPGDTNQCRFINDTHMDSQSAFGNLCAFTPGEWTPNPRSATYAHSRPGTCRL